MINEPATASESAPNLEEDYHISVIDNVEIINHASDPATWTPEYKQQFILWLYDMDELPEGWEKLFVRGDPHKTCDRCYKVKARSEYFDRQWRGQDNELMCKQCWNGLY